MEIGYCAVPDHRRRLPGYWQVKISSISCELLIFIQKKVNGMYYDIMYHMIKFEKIDIVLKIWQGFIAG